MPCPKAYGGAIFHSCWERETLALIMVKMGLTLYKEEIPIKLVIIRN